MVKKNLTILIIISACSTADNRPADLVPENKMALILTEIHILEAKIKQLGIQKNDSMQAVYDHYERLLFNDFGIDKSQYERSFNYYVNHPKEFNTVYETVVDTLALRQKLQN